MLKLGFSYCPVCGNLNITDIYGVSGTSSSTIMRMSGAAQVVSCISREVRSNIVEAIHVRVAHIYTNDTN